MEVTIYYTVGNGMVNYLSTTLDGGTLLFHEDDPTYLKRSCVDLVYQHEKDEGREVVGKISIHAITALEEIAKAEGAYSQNPLLHAENTIANMQTIATDYLSSIQNASE